MRLKFVLEFYLPPSVVQLNSHLKLAWPQIINLQVCHTSYRLLAIIYNVLIGVFDVTIYFDECERRNCVSVNVADNLPDPSTTSFDLSLTRTANLNPRIALQPQAESEFYILISNSCYFIFFQPDFITVGYSLVTYTTTESQGRVEVTVIIIQPPSRRAPRSFSIIMNTEDATASKLFLL